MVMVSPNILLHFLTYLTLPALKHLNMSGFFEGLRLLYLVLNWSGIVSRNASENNQNDFSSKVDLK